MQSRLKTERLLTCESCGIQFLYTSAEQQARRPEGPPALCPGCAALERLPARRRGTVRWYDRQKGFGFIHGEDGGDVFVHRSGLEQKGRGLRSGQPVEYLLEQTDKGPSARNVTAVAE